MHYQDIGNIAINALLSLHSNKGESKLSNKSYLRTFLSKKLNSNKLSPCVQTYFKGLLDRAAANPLSFSIESNLTRIHEDTMAVDAHLNQFNEVSMRSRLDSLATLLAKDDYLNLANFNKDASELPDTDKAILVWASEYSKFTDTGELTDKLIIRVKTDDLYPFVHAAYQSGLLVFKVASDDLIHDFSISPGNDSEGAAFPITTKEALEKRQSELAQFNQLQRDRLKYTKRNSNPKKARKKRK